MLNVLANYAGKPIDHLESSLLTEIERDVEEFIQRFGPVSALPSLVSALPKNTPDVIQGGLDLGRQLLERLRTTLAALSDRAALVSCIPDALRILTCVGMIFDTLRILSRTRAHTGVYSQTNNLQFMFSALGTLAAIRQVLHFVTFLVETSPTPEVDPLQRFSRYRELVHQACLTQRNLLLLLRNVALLERGPVQAFAAASLENPDVVRAAVDISGSPLELFVTDSMTIRNQDTLELLARSDAQLRTSLRQAVKDHDFDFHKLLYFTRRYFGTTAKAIGWHSVLDILAALLVAPAVPSSLSWRFTMRLDELVPGEPCRSPANSNGGSESKASVYKADDPELHNGSEGKCDSDDDDEYEGDDTEPKFVMLLDAVSLDSLFAIALVCTSNAALLAPVLRLPGSEPASRTSTATNSNNSEVPYFLWASAVMWALLGLTSAKYVPYLRSVFEAALGTHRQHLLLVTGSNHTSPSQSRAMPVSAPSTPAEGGQREAPETADADHIGTDSFTLEFESHEDPDESSANLFNFTDQTNKLHYIIPTYSSSVLAAEFAPTEPQGGDECRAALVTSALRAITCFTYACEAGAVHPVDGTMFSRSQIELLARRYGFEIDQIEDALQRALQQDADRVQSQIGYTPTGAAKAIVESDDTRGEVSSCGRQQQPFWLRVHPVLLAACGVRIGALLSIDATSAKVSTGKAIPPMYSESEQPNSLSHSDPTFAESERVQQATSLASQVFIGPTWLVHLTELLGSQVWPWNEQVGSVAFISPVPGYLAPLLECNPHSLVSRADKRFSEWCCSSSIASPQAPRRPSFVTDSHELRKALDTLKDAAIRLLSGERVRLLWLALQWSHGAAVAGICYHIKRLLVDHAGRLDAVMSKFRELSTSTHAALVVLRRMLYIAHPVYGAETVFRSLFESKGTLSAALELVKSQKNRQHEGSQTNATQPSSHVTNEAMLPVGAASERDLDGRGNRTLRAILLQLMLSNNTDLARASGELLYALCERLAERYLVEQSMAGEVPINLERIPLPSKTQREEAATALFISMCGFGRAVGLLVNKGVAGFAQYAQQSTTSKESVSDLFGLSP